MKTGVLLINLGSPASPNKKDVFKYLTEFLTDPWVIDKPAFIRYPLVYGIIAPTRAKASAELYHNIWTPKGSPLLVNSEELKVRLQEKMGNDYIVELGMRYGTPSITQGLEKLYGQKVDSVFCLPLYPQYAASSTQTAIEVIKSFPHQKPVHILNPFYADEGFLQPQGQLLFKEWRANNWDLVLFSFHGLPERHMRKLDKNNYCFSRKDCSERASSETLVHCYRAQCFVTAKKLAQKVGIEPNQMKVSFQSRLGREPWIQPFTDELLTSLPKKGIKKILVVCPSFTADCLETLEEIQIRGQAIFTQAGGQVLKQVECVNANPQWVSSLKDWIQVAQPHPLWTTL